MEAVKWCEMVRVNPGNYADSKKFDVREYSDEEYAAELARIEKEFALGRGVQTRNRALRHRHQSRLVERPHHEPLRRHATWHGGGALEFARIARDRDFHTFKFSMKSSNPKVMIECYGCWPRAWPSSGRIGTTHCTSA